MTPRRSIKRKYRPGFEALERKQLLSAGPPTGGLEVVQQGTAPVPSHVVNQQPPWMGTGKGIRIVTS
jgi:hypothetical protein